MAAGDKARTPQQEDGKGGPKKRGRKQDDSLPPSRSRDIQRAFRARRAALLANLEARVVFLEAENKELRRRLGLPPDGPPVAGEEPELVGVESPTSGNVSIPGGKGWTPSTNGAAKGTARKRRVSEAITEDDGEDGADGMSPLTSTRGLEWEAAAALADPQVGAAAEVLMMGRSAPSSAAPSPTEDQTQAIAQQRNGNPVPNGYAALSLPPSPANGHAYSAEPMPLPPPGAYSSAPGPSQYHMPLQYQNGSMPQQFQRYPLQQSQQQWQYPPGAQPFQQGYPQSPFAVPQPSLLPFQQLPPAPQHQPRLPSPSHPQQSFPSPQSQQFPNTVFPQSHALPQPPPYQTAPPFPQYYQHQPRPLSPVPQDRRASTSQYPVVLPPVSSFGQPPAPLGPSPSEPRTSVTASSHSSLACNRIKQEDGVDAPDSLADEHDTLAKQRVFLLRCCNLSPEPSAEEAPDSREAKYRAFCVKLIEGVIQAARNGRVAGLGAGSAEKAKARATKLPCCDGVMNCQAGTEACHAVSDVDVDGKRTGEEAIAVGEQDDECCGGLIDCSAPFFDDTPSYPADNAQNASKGGDPSSSSYADPQESSARAPAPFPILRIATYLPVREAFDSLERYMLPPLSPSSDSRGLHTPEKLASMLFDGYPPVRSDSTHGEADPPHFAIGGSEELRVWQTCVELTAKGAELKRLVETGECSMQEAMRRTEMADTAGVQSVTIAPIKSASASRCAGRKGCC
ncbi:proteophosphoglycan ppg4 [Rhodotorula toruloides]|uniref:Proteophosphoglycan ppg4 n=1 Tax=Rhodotorula toruloides TaxID=5286 RepID=A0A511KLL3_RHOTO|nr:proteophosphoglycan ppg4 [Rhodotorula toruloides]